MTTWISDNLKRILFVAIFVAANSTLAAEQTENNLTITNVASREHIDLSGDWVYSKDLYKTGLTDINGWVAKSRMQRYRDINVAEEEIKNPSSFFEFDMQRGPKMHNPTSWNSAVTELRYYTGLIWFQKEIELKLEPGKRAFIHFEAVNYHAIVYINGKKIGEHKGGFTPFAFEVTANIRTGLNRITVGVDGTHDAESIPSTITDWDLYAGITRTPRLVFTPQTFIDDAYLQMDKNGQLIGEVKLNGPQSANSQISVDVSGLAKPIKLTTQDNGLATIKIAAPTNLKLWSPKNPHLHKVSFKTTNDQLDEKIGFRKITTKGNQILLNGKPIFLAGISLHEEEIGVNPARNMTEEAIRRLFTEIKNGLHANYIRLSHYPHSELALRIADEMGLLIWSEIPVYWSIDYKSEKVLENAKQMMRENIYRDRNRASIIIWSIANETPVADDRNAFLKKLANNVRETDSSRLISAALLVERKKAGSPIEIETNDPLVDSLDVLAVNTYNGWYGDDKLAAIASTIWHTPNNKPLIISEFGADAKAGVHTSGEPFKFSEEYQAEYYKQTLLMANQMKNLCGMSPWILKDFRSPRREHPIYQQGWNRKGLISETGERKLAFDVLANYYAQRKH